MAKDWASADRIMTVTNPLSYPEDAIPPPDVNGHRLGLPGRLCEAQRPRDLAHPQERYPLRVHGGPPTPPTLMNDVLEGDPVWVALLRELQLRGSLSKQVRRHRSHLLYAWTVQRHGGNQGSSGP